MKIPPDDDPVERARLLQAIKDEAAADLRKLADDVEAGKVEGFYLLHKCCDDPAFYGLTALLSEDVEPIRDMLQAARRNDLPQPTTHTARKRRARKGQR